MKHQNHRSNGLFDHSEQWHEMARKLKWCGALRLNESQAAISGVFDSILSSLLLTRYAMDMAR